MKKVFVPEDLNEFAKRGRPRKNKAAEVIPDMEDTWYNADDEFDSGELTGPEQIEDVEIEDETIDHVALNKLKRMIDNELKIPESGRAHASFKLRSTGERVSGVPLAKLSGGEAVLFKTNKGMKKVNVNDILLESVNETKELKYVAESLKDYDQED